MRLPYKPKLQSGSGLVTGLLSEHYEISVGANNSLGVVAIGPDTGGQAGPRVWTFPFNAAGIPTIIDAGGIIPSKVRPTTVHGQTRTQCWSFLRISGARAIYRGFGDTNGGVISIPFVVDNISNLRCDPELINGNFVPGLDAGLSGRGLAVVTYSPYVDQLYKTDRIAYFFYPSAANPIDDAGAFVRENYESFLNRAPDTAGLNYWTSEITRCGANTSCVHNRRLDVSAAFFVEQEFQNSGFFAYLTRRATLGPAPLFAEYQADRALLGTGAESGQQAFLNDWVQQPAFLAKYPASLSGAQFINALLTNAQQATGVNLSGLAPALLNDYTQFGSRARVVRLVVNDAALRQAEYRKAFVLMQYFGYLQRDTDAAGYQFWLERLNENPNNYRGMVCAFVTSAEYQQRFAPLVTRSNADCR